MTHRRPPRYTGRQPHGLTPSNNPTVAVGDPMEIALYYAPITCALAPYITLTEAGATFEVRPLNFRKGQHTSPQYLKINPKHKVPMLVVDGKFLTESIAIQTWIARTFPQAKLLPADPWQELQA